MGPLAGIRIVEIAGIGPAPYCAMVLADLGAEVIRVDRPGGQELGLPLPPHLEVLNRGRASIALDLKKDGAVDVVLRLLADADGLIEGLRPGVMERLGLGPDTCLERNPRLVYGRVTGWGQKGPLARTAGHDINYISLTGALAAVGPSGGKPVPPLNLIGDFGGGAMYLAVGMLAAILAARESGRGQVVDAAMVDGANQLMSMFHALTAGGMWSGGRGENLLDGGAPFYDTYETKDGRYVAVGAIEPKFYATLLEGLGLMDADLPAQNDRAAWPQLRRKLAGAIKTRTQAEWVAVFDGSDACVSPVLDLEEVAGHSHNVARDAFIDVSGVTQPRPAPRFSGTATGIPGAPVAAGADSRAVLTAAGYGEAEICALLERGVVHEAPA